MSGVNCERPVARYQPPDWHARNYKMADNARAKREESLNLRKEAQQLKIETDTRTKWHNFDNNMRLSERYVYVLNGISGCLLDSRGLGSISRSPGIIFRGSGEQSISKGPG